MDIDLSKYGGQEEEQPNVLYSTPEDINSLASVDLSKYGGTEEIYSSGLQDTSGMSLNNRATLANELMNNDPNVSVGATAIPDMGSDEKANLMLQLASQDRTAPPIDAMPADIAGQRSIPLFSDLAPNELSGVYSDQLRQQDVLNDRVTSKKALFNGIIQPLTLNFDDEIYGMANLLSGIVHGQVKDWDDATDLYRSYRDLRRAENSALHTKHPFISTAGQGLGAIMLPSSAIGKLASLPTKMMYKEFGKIGLLYGTIFGMGGSNADLTKGEWLPFTMDTAVGSGLGLIGGLAAAGATQLMTGGRLNIANPQGTKAAAQQIAGGKIPAKSFQGPHADLLDDSVKVLEKNGILKRSMSGIEMGTGDGSFSTYKNLLTKPGKIDHDVLIGEIDSLSGKLTNQLTDIYERAELAKPGMTSINEIWGPKGLSNLKRIADELSLHDEAADAAQLFYQKYSDLLSFDKMFATDVSELRKLFGSNYALTSLLDKTKGAYRQLYMSLDKHLRQTVRSALPDDFATYSSLTHDLKALALAKDNAILGKAVAEYTASKDPRYSAGNIINQGLKAVTHGGKGGLLTGLISSAANPLVKGAGLIMSNPKSNAYWATYIFPSFSRGHVSNVQDKELGKHYILKNDKLSPQQKTQAIQHLNKSGSFDLSNIPEEIRQQAIQNSRMIQ